MNNPSSSHGLRERSDPQRHQDRAIFLAAALVPALQKHLAQLARLADQLMTEMDPPTLKRLHRRYFRLSEQDMASFRQLREDGAHRSVLLQYLAATQAQALEDLPSRDKVYRDYQERLSKQEGQKPFELAVRVATPVLFVTTCALVLPWALSKGAVAAGVGLSLANPALDFLDPVAGPVVELVMQETGGWLARAGLAVGAWVGWGYAARVLPDLKSTLSQPETEILAARLGPAQQNWKLHSAVRKIPHADRHLLAHLLPTELRAFLRGDDEQRREILQRQPPPLMAEVMSILATHPPGLKAFFQAVRDLGDLCLPEAWRKGWLKNPQLDMNHRLERWRTGRNEDLSEQARSTLDSLKSRRRRRSVPDLPTLPSSPSRPEPN